MPLVAQALAGVDLKRLDLEVLSLGEDRVDAPRAVDMFNRHPAILPDSRCPPRGRRSCRRIASRKSAVS
jgi:hypothetical protein